MEQSHHLSFEALVQLGHALYGQGRYPEAVKALDEALHVRPGDANVWNDRGIMLGTLKRLAEALESYNKAIALSPDYPEAFYNRGSLLIMLLKPDEALASYDRAVALNPDFAVAWNNRGSVLLELGRPKDALASYDRAIELSPSYAEAHGNRAAVLTNLERHREALASADMAIEIRSNAAEFYDHRATALARMHRPEEALVSYDRAVALKADFVGAHSNRASVLLDLKRPEDALLSCDRAIAINPDSAEPYNNRGSALTELKRFDEALASYTKAIALKPGYAAAWGNRGMLLLLTGLVTEGWASWRRFEQLLWAKTSHADLRPWTCGEDIRDKTLFIEVDGFGDAIQFCRRIAQLEAQGAKVICALPRPLLSLLKDISPTVRIVEAGAPPTGCDRYVSLYNLAEGFPPDDRCPAGTPYLRADGDRTAQWKRLLGDSGFKIGICWQGSLADVSRSFPVGFFQSLAEIPGVRLISLQKGPLKPAELPRAVNVESLGDSFDAGPDAFLDTAAVMENLDLIIAPDTAIAHLAGALGRPVWVALKYAPDWRWHLDRCDTPWYPSMRLFRQHAYGDWSGAFAEMAEQLRGSLESAESTG
jgi:tetratricopeptide (TPR) repeat protein